MMDEKGKGEGSSAGAIPGGTERILFVDDEEAMAELGQATLAKLGYEVIATKSSMEAFALFMQDPKRFDLVITDQTMPEMTGLVLATKLLKERPGLPVILCTGYSENISRETAKETGIREFVMKPASKKEMAEAVRRALAGPKSS
jgi:CheY-like chemotaxis protein